MDIRLPANFTSAHRAAVLRFVQGKPYDRSRRERLLVVFLKRSAWDAIDGETLPTTLTALPDILPTVAEIEHSGQTLIVVEYEEWKMRVLKYQRREEM